MSNLRELREKALLTQDELAKAAGLSRDTVHRIEKNKQKASFQTIKKLAAALNVPPDQIER